MRQPDDHGTTSAQNQSQSHRNHADEETPLLHSSTPDPQTNPNTRLLRHLSTPITASWTDLLLLHCYLITGLLDSSAIFIWGSFVSMQTGNTVYLGLGLVDSGGSNRSGSSSNGRHLKALASIISFCVGSFCFARFHRAFSPRRRWVLLTSFLFQTALIVIAAVMVTLGTPDEPGLDWHVVVPLVLLAFQSSGQAVASRVLAFNGLPSVVLTSTYCDLFSDPKLFAAGFAEAPERNRRIAAPLLLLLGACCGGLFSKSSFGLAGALWVAAGLKGMVVLAWLLWDAEDKEGNEE